MFTTPELNKLISLAVVESVRDGTTLRVRLFMPDGEHQFVNITLAGARSPRAASRLGETSEPSADEVRRMVLRHVARTLILSSKPYRRNISRNRVSFNGPSKYSFFPYPSRQPLRSRQTVAAHRRLRAYSLASVCCLTVFLVLCAYPFYFPVLHPVGNIAEFLLGAGLAHLVEWHSGMLAPYGGSEKLRAADRAARDKRLGLHANAPVPSAISKSLSGTANGLARAFEGTVVRVWSGDQISILTKDGKERRIQLSSTRGPKYAYPIILLAAY